MANISYQQMFAEFRKRDNFAEMYRHALEDMAGKVDFSQVKSCVAFGTGSGEHEIEFVRRLLPNLRSFIAVEPDPESVKTLRANFQNGQLPGVETSIIETSLESWSGVDNRVDAVLLFNVLNHVHSANRKDLFQKLMKRYLSYGGLIVFCTMCDNIGSITNGFTLLLERLGTPRADYYELEEEILAAGFRILFSKDIEVRQDLSNPSDGLVKFIQMRTGHKSSDSEVRTAIDEIFAQPNVGVNMNKLTIFTK